MSPLDAAARARFAALADHLIPEADGMPAPSSVGIGGAQLDVVLRFRPDLADPLWRALDAAADDPDAAMSRLRAHDPEAHAALVTAVVAGYYLSGEVQARLGYPGQQAVPIALDTFPPYVEEGLLDQVLERGPIYRRGRDGEDAGPSAW